MIRYTGKVKETFFRAGKNKIEIKVEPGSIVEADPKIEDLLSQGRNFEKVNKEKPKKSQEIKSKVKDNIVDLKQQNANTKEVK